MGRAVAAQTAPVGVWAVLSDGEEEGQRRTLGLTRSARARLPPRTATPLEQGPGAAGSGRGAGSHLAETLVVKVAHSLA